ncbi:MAG: hypothetical protein JWO36_5020 [Myxococcales bacterium]|nr:hypothetical protein [Myxococcales bacterium]
MDLYITGYGSKLVPRVPFCVTFRPPKIAVETGAKVVFFGPAGDGLGFSPKGDATVEDVTVDLTEYPSVPIYSVHTQDFAVPVTDHVKVYSALETSGHSFEVQLADAAHRDEMLWVEGPLSVPLDLQNAAGTLEVVDEGTVEKSNGAARWRECRYVLDGSTWHKRFYALMLLSTKELGVEIRLALLAQCPAPRRTTMFDLSDRWAAALTSTAWREGR